MVNAAIGVPMLVALNSPVAYPDKLQASGRKIGLRFVARGRRLLAVSMESSLHR